MAIKIKHRDPKSTDFSSTDIIININVKLNITYDELMAFMKNIILITIDRKYANLFQLIETIFSDYYSTKAKNILLLPSREGDKIGTRPSSAQPGAEIIAQGGGIIFNGKIKKPNGKIKKPNGKNRKSIRKRYKKTNYSKYKKKKNKTKKKEKAKKE